MIVLAALMMPAVPIRADVIYCETFGRDPNNGGTGNINPSNFDWQRWNASGAVTGTTGAGINGTDDGRPTDLPNLNAGSYYLNATPGPFPRGWMYLDGTARLGMTTELVINPANYVPGSIVFSWYQGNAALNQPLQVAVRVGGVWYASVQTFDNTGVATAAGFGTLPGGAGGSELRSFTYSTAAANWLVLNFNGDFDTNSHTATASSTALSLGANPASDLSGDISAFGFYRNVTGSNARFDSYTVTATPIPPGTGKPVVWNGAAGADWDATTFNWLAAGNLTNFTQGDFVTFDDSGSNTTINITAVFSPGSLTVGNSTVTYTFGGGGGVGGTGGLTKNGSGTLILQTANTYSGQTVISNGTINVGNGGGAGTLGTGNVLNNGALLFNRTNNLNVNNAISGSGSLTQNGTGTLTLGGLGTYTGSTVVNAGTLVVNGILSGGGSLTTVAGTTLAGRGTNSGPVIVAGAISPGTSAGTFISGALTLAAGATATFELNSATTVGGGVNDLLQVNGNLTLNNNTLSVVLLGQPQIGVPYRLINFTGTRSGSFTPAVTIVGGSRLTATLSYNNALGQVEVIFSGAVANLRWDSQGDLNWNVATTTNWQNLGTSAPDVFFDFDSVLFNDTPGLQSTVDIGDGVTVRPSQITVDSTNTAYFIGGLGRIAGAAGVTKRGPSTLSLGVQTTPTAVELRLMEAWCV